MRRFLNSDSYGSTGQGILGYNMFAYCNNNPVISTDSTGHSCVALDPVLGGGTKKKSTPTPSPVPSFVDHPGPPIRPDRSGPTIQPDRSGPTIQPAYTGPIGAPRSYTCSREDIDLLCKAFDIIGSVGTGFMRCEMSTTPAIRALEESIYKGASKTCTTVSIVLDAGMGLYENIIAPPINS